jgi:formate dehydrogenase subunit delta
MTSLDRLIYMANQIATNLAHEEDPAGAMRKHLADFWDPRMKAMIIANGDKGLSPVAAAAIARLG